MKFTGEGNTIVWDRERERELCRFTKGEYESEDPRTCEILISLGYAYEGELAEEPEIDEELQALRAQAKELKIKSAHSMKKEKLIAAIEAAVEAAKGETP